MSSDSKARTRFAPSPTGFLHIGGVRTALYNYLLAKQSGGSFILRLEDTDRERFVAAGIEQIVEGLDWLGLIPDEGFWISEGQHQNIEYIQSERQKTGIYRNYAERLLKEGLAYYSIITPEKYTEHKKDPKLAPFVYKKRLEAEYRNDGVIPDKNHGHPIRLDTDAIKKKFSDVAANGLVWQDEVRGEFTESISLIEDFIIIKSDGFPTYNFANVIDDHEMNITHVLRGNEFVSSTGKHALLNTIFGWQPPKYVHLSVINGADGKKLSKRTGDTSVLDYRDKGYLPEALLNFLSLLGWNDGTEQEIFSLDELIKKFKLERINTSPAIFDQKRLDWMNGCYIRQMPLDKLYEFVEAKSNKPPFAKATAGRQKAISSFWPVEAREAKEEHKKAILALVQERLKYLAELVELTVFFFAEPSLENVLKLYKDPVDKQLKKSPSNYKGFLEAIIEALSSSDFSAEDIQTRLNKLLESLNTKPAVLFPVIRIAITGSSVSPEIFGTLAVLGKEKSLQRLNNALRSLE